eukprot:Skav236174  [mRNA]  locus=scaffold298:419749:435915:- [translate_table: standard]
MPCKWRSCNQGRRRWEVHGGSQVYDINPELVDDQGFVDILKDLLGDGRLGGAAGKLPRPAPCKESHGGGQRRGRPGGNQPDLRKGSAGSGPGEHPQAAGAGARLKRRGLAAAGQDALATYEPTGPNDAESITERVTARLSHANPAVVLTAIKENPEVLRMLAKKLNPPLAPRQVKLEKVDIMCMLVSDKNFDQVLLELKEYASGVDVEFVRKSVRSIGRVAVKLERACERAMNVLLELIETKVNYVVQDAWGRAMGATWMVKLGIVTTARPPVARRSPPRYPSRYEQVLSALCESMEALDEPEAKASMIWILGEYAGRIDNADELLESFLDKQLLGDAFHDEPLLVQMQLLTAIVKLFLQKPSSTQETPLRCGWGPRGYIYWRLLATNPEATKSPLVVSHGGRL